MYLNYHHILVFCFNLKVAPLTSSLPPVVSFSYVQERMLVNSEHIMRPALRLFSVSNQERILVQFETKTKLRLFTVLNAINLLYLFFGFTQVIHIFAVTFSLVMILGSTGQDEARPQGPTGKSNSTTWNHIMIPRITANSPGYKPTSTRKTCIEKIIPITICNKCTKLQFVRNRTAAVESREEITLHPFHYQAIVLKVEKTVGSLFPHIQWTTSILCISNVAIKI